MNHPQGVAHAAASAAHYIPHAGLFGLILYRAMSFFGFVETLWEKTEWLRALLSLKRKVKRKVKRKKRSR